VHNVVKVVHRDIKPGNILVDDNDDIKLADFGISEMTDTGKMTQNKSGTKYYLPPEVFSEKLIKAGKIDI
jgi:[calcium/calmodulin-dependent protein kinase] kinase